MSSDIFGSFGPPMTKVGFCKGELKMKNPVVRVSCAAAIFVVAILLCAAVANAQGSAAATFTAKCAACHGPDGKGETSVGKTLGIHDLASPDTQNLSDADLTQIIAKGKNKMPAYGDSLKEPEIKDLVAYIRDLGKKK
jgi:mono/diheme cytochrome c family protein